LVLAADYPGQLRRNRKFVIRKTGRQEKTEENRSRKART
jgi:hypothetical protein